jgi:hypothetical protein
MSWEAEFMTDGETHKALVRGALAGSVLAAAGVVLSTLCVYPSLSTPELLPIQASLAAAGVHAGSQLRGIKVALVSVAIVLASYVIAAPLVSISMQRYAATHMDLAGRRIFAPFPSQADWVEMGIGLVMAIWFSMAPFRSATDDSWCG